MDINCISCCVVLTLLKCFYVSIAYSIIFLFVLEVSLAGRTIKLGLNMNREKHTCFLSL